MPLTRPDTDNIFVVVRGSHVMRKDHLGLSCSSHSVPPDSPPLCEIVVCIIHECTGSASGAQEKGPEAKKKKKNPGIWQK